MTDQGGLSPGHQAEARLQEHLLEGHLHLVANEEDEPGSLPNPESYLAYTGSTVVESELLTAISSHEDFIERQHLFDFCREMAPDIRDQSVAILAKAIFVPKIRTEARLEYVDPEQLGLVIQVRGSDGQNLPLDDLTGRYMAAQRQTRVIQLGGLIEFMKLPKETRMQLFDYGDQGEEFLSRFTAWADWRIRYKQAGIDVDNPTFDEERRSAEESEAQQSLRQRISERFQSGRQSLVADFSEAVHDPNLAAEFSAAAAQGVAEAKANFEVYYNKLEHEARRLAVDAVRLVAANKSETIMTQDIHSIEDQDMIAVLYAMLGADTETTMLAYTPISHDWPDVDHRRRQPEAIETEITTASGVQLRQTVYPEKFLSKPQRILVSVVLPQGRRG